MSQGESSNTVDEYTLVSCIASGNSSQVWEVSSSNDPGHMAMKLLLPEALADAASVATIKHEYKVGKQLDHPNIVKFHKVVVNKKNAYIVMDYFRAPNLKQQIGSDFTGVHTRIRKLVEGLCLSIGYMHDKGYVHKDLKPENILFTKGSELRLIDFSLSAKIVAGIGKFFAGKLKVVQGTRTYIAPETINKEQATPQTDMYSLGITLFEVLTGAPPFKGASPNDLLKKHLSAKPPNPSDMNSNITPECDRFILKMLSKKPKDRHKTMDEVFAEFRSFKVFKEDVQELADRKEKDLVEKNRQTFDGQRTRLSSRLDAERTEAAAGSADEIPAATPAGAAAPTSPAAQPAAAVVKPAAVAQPAPQMPAAPGRPAAQPAPAVARVATPGYAPPPGAAPPGYAPPQMVPGNVPAGRPPQGFPPGSFPPGAVPTGYPPQGYPQQGYPQQGYPQQGYPQQGAPYPPGQRPPMPLPAGYPQPPRPGMPAPSPGYAAPAAGPAGVPPQAVRPGASPQPRPGQPAHPQGTRPAPPPAAKPVVRPAAPAKPATPAEADDLPLMEDLPPIA